MLIELTEVEVSRVFVPIGIFVIEAMLGNTLAAVLENNSAVPHARVVKHPRFRLPSRLLLARSRLLSRRESDDGCRRAREKRSPAGDFPFAIVPDAHGSRGSSMGEDVLAVRGESPRPPRFTCRELRKAYKQAATSHTR